LSDDEIKDLDAVLAGFRAHGPKRAAAEAAGMCGSCCDVGHWDVPATSRVIPRPTVRGAIGYCEAGHPIHRVCDKCARRYRDGFGCAILRLVT
jgi:hypothetical protein